MTADQYSQAEIQELIAYLGVELREQKISEDEFRRGVAKYGFNATDIDQLVSEAWRPT